MPVVWRSFMVQWVIWSRTTWSKITQAIVTCLYRGLSVAVEGSLFQKQPGWSRHDFLLCRVRYCQPAQLWGDGGKLDFDGCHNNLRQANWDALKCHHFLLPFVCTVSASPLNWSVVFYCLVEADVQHTWWKKRMQWWWWWRMHLLHYTVKQWLPEWFGKVNETVSIISSLIIQWLMRLELIINMPTVVEAAAWREQRVCMFHCENI